MKAESLAYKIAVDVKILEKYLPKDLYLEAMNNEIAKEIAELDKIIELLDKGCK